MDAISLELLFTGTILFIAAAVEIGYRIGNTLDESQKNIREKITSTNVAAILSLLAFILVFAFGIVYSRFDTKKELVRQEASIIRDVWLRSDFLPEQDRLETRKLLQRYVNLRIEVAESKQLDMLHSVLDETERIQQKIWDTAVLNAKKDMNSDVAALYIESLNEMINQHALRLTIGVIVRIPGFIWVILFLLIFLGMFSIGYQTAITNSTRRSWLTPVMILTVSLMVLLIASLDRPQSRFVEVPQQPLKDLKVSIDKGENLPR